MSITRGVINLLIPESLKNAGFFTQKKKNYEFIFIIWNKDRDALIDYAIKRAKDKNFCYQGQKAVLLQGFFKGLVDMEHYIVKLMKIN